MKSVHNSCCSGDRNPERGYTLIEMVVVIVIMSIIAAVTVRYVVSACQMYAQVYAQAQADNETGDGLSRMRTEIRTLKNVLAADTNMFSFTTQAGTTNIFQYTGTNVTLNGNMLARDVGVFRFSYFDVTNGVTTNSALIRRIGLSFKVVRGGIADDLNVNFFLKDGLIK